jgi:hypothetical protein
VSTAVWKLVGILLLVLATACGTWKVQGWRYGSVSQNRPVCLLQRLLNELSPSLTPGDQGLITMEACQAYLRCKIRDCFRSAGRYRRAL